MLVLNIYYSDYCNVIYNEKMVYLFVLYVKKLFYNVYICLLNIIMDKIYIMI